MKNSCNVKTWRASKSIAAFAAVLIFPIAGFGQPERQKGDEQPPPKQQQQQQRAAPQQQPQRAPANQPQRSVSQQPNRPAPENQPMRGSQPANQPQRSVAQQPNRPAQVTQPSRPIPIPDQRQRNAQQNQQPNRPTPVTQPNRPIQGLDQQPRNAQHADQPVRPNESMRPSNQPARTPQHNADIRVNPQGLGGRGPINVGASHGGQVYRTPKGNEAHVRRDGSIQTVRSRGMEITHGPAGSRRIVAEGPGQRVIVTNNAGHGYIQRPYSFLGREYVNRTFYSHGRPYNRVYRPIEFRGRIFNAYVPLRYYPPAFYSWTLGFWASPVPYRWGWYSDPWYRYYGWYFRPYPLYPSAAYWLTDFAIAGILQAAYQDRLDALEGAPPRAYASGQIGMTTEVKQAIASEVERQLAEERAESQVGSADVIRSVSESISDNRPHVFVVSLSLEVMTSDGVGCPIGEGDVIVFQGVLPADAVTANVRVLASKPGDCPEGSLVSVPLEDLQEMQNRLRDYIDQGLDEMRTTKGGLPAIPPQAAGAATVNPLATAAPPPDPDVIRELASQAQQAKLAEDEVIGEFGSVTEGLPVISLDQPIDEVVRILGAPMQIANLGPKQIYVYKNMKITFIDGKIVDVQ